MATNSRKDASRKRILELVDGPRKSIKVCYYNDYCYEDYINSIPETLRTIKGLFKRYYPAGKVVVNVGFFEDILRTRLESIKNRIVEFHSHIPLYRTYNSNGGFSVVASGDRMTRLIERLDEYTKTETPSYSESIDGIMRLLRHQAKEMYSEYFSYLHEDYTNVLALDGSKMSVYDFPIEITSMIMEYCAKADPYLPSTIPCLSRWFNRTFGDPIFAYQTQLAAVEDMKFNLLYNLASTFEMRILTTARHNSDDYEEERREIDDESCCILKFDPFAGRCTRVYSHKCTCHKEKVKKTTEVHNAAHMIINTQADFNDEMLVLHELLNEAVHQEYEYERMDEHNNYVKGRILNFGSNMLVARRVVEIVFEFMRTFNGDRKVMKQSTLLSLRIPLTANTWEEAERYQQVLQNYMIEGYEFYALHQSQSIVTRINQKCITRTLIFGEDFDAHVEEILDKFHTGELKPSLFYATTPTTTKWPVFFNGLDEYDYYKFSSMIGFYNQTILAKPVKTEEPTAMLKWHPDRDLKWHRGLAVDFHKKFIDEEIERIEQYPRLTEKELINSCRDVFAMRRLRSPFMSMLGIVDTIYCDPSLHPNQSKKARSPGNNRK